MVRYPVFSSHTSIKGIHVMSRYLWMIVGFSVTYEDKGVEITLGDNSIDEVGMIKGKVHVIHGTCELSYPATRYCLVINVGIHKFHGAFNAEMPREIVAKPSAPFGLVFQVLIFLKYIVPSERFQFKASFLYL